MIDWITLPDFPCRHPQPVDGGHVLSVDRDGNMEWSSKKFLKVVGSSDASIRIKTTAVDRDGTGTHLAIDGNPAKFLQGHNLWGTDDLVGLVVAFMDKLVPLVGLDPTPWDRQLWLRGCFRLTRTDLTRMFRLANRADALAWIRQAEQTATMPYRGKGQITKGNTLYFGKHSRRSALKFYAKGQEFEANGSPAMKELPALVEYADSALRAEYVIRSMELKRLGLDCAANWDENTSSGVTLEVLGKLHMDDYTMITPERIDELRPAVRAVYQLWKEGHDIRGMYPKPTFYRYRKQLLDTLSVDIANVQPRDDKLSNVVPLIRVLEATEMTVPDWAYGTPLYAEPRHA